MKSKIYFYTSAMNSGKTNAVIGTAYNYKELGFNPVVIKPMFDTRSGSPTQLISRAGSEWNECFPLPVTDAMGRDSITSDLVSLLMSTEKLGAIIIDEVQFISVNQLTTIYKLARMKEVPLICYGLRNNYQGGGFPASDWLLQNAQKIEFMKTLCWCGSAATHNQRIINGTPYNREIHGEGSTTIVGGNDDYKSVCFKHFLEGAVNPENQ